MTGALLTDRRLPLLCSLFVLAFVLALFPLSNTDIWWHLATARYMVEQGSWLYSDPFSISSHGVEWFNLHWLFQLAALGLYSIGGVAGLVLAKCALFAVAAVVLWWASQLNQKSDSALRAVGALAVFFLCLLVGRHLVLARPVVCTLFFISLYLLLLRCFLRDRRLGWLLLLPLLQVIWVNTQPLFPLGLVVLCCFFVGEAVALGASRLGFVGIAAQLSSKELLLVALVVLAVGLASLVNPYGLSGALLPLKLFTRLDPATAGVFSQAISENVAPFVLERRGDTAASFFKWVAALTFGSFLLRWRRQSPFTLLLVLAFWVTALMANRNLLLFYWVAAYAVAVNIYGAASPSWLQAYRPLRLVMKSRFLQSPVLVVVGTLACTAVLLSAPGAISIGRISPFKVPQQAVLQLAELCGDRGEPKAIFSSVRYGGYLLWSLFPGCLPYFDGRFVLRSPRQFTDYLQLVDQPQGFDRLLLQHDFRAVVLPYVSPSRYQSLALHLYRDLQWRLHYTDGTQLMFVRREQFTDPGMELSNRGDVAKIVEDLEARFPSTSSRKVALGNLAQLLADFGHTRRALEVLPDGGQSGQRAQIIWAAGDGPTAENMATRVLEDNENDLNALLVLAQIHLKKGERDEAISLLGKVLQQSPHNKLVQQILERISKPYQKSEKNEIKQ